MKTQVPEPPRTPSRPAIAKETPIHISPKPTLAGYLAALRDRRLMPAALRVALAVGTLLFALNHGSALLQGKMTRDRWLSALLTYLVPYSVNIQGQYAARLRWRDRAETL